MIAGNVHYSSWHEMPADTRALSRFKVPVGGKVPKLAAYVDGFGSGTGPQELRAVIYDARGDLVAFSDLVTIDVDQAEDWIDFSFLGEYPDGGPALDPGYHTLGLHAGDSTATARVAVEEARWNRAIEPSFETSEALSWANASDAQVTLGVLEREEAGAGVRGLRIVATKDANATSRTFLFRTATGAAGMPATPGVQYSASLRAQIGDNLVSGVGLRFAWYNGASLLSSSTMVPSLGTGAKVLTHAATAPANTTHFSLQLVGTSTTSGDVLDLWFDEVVVEEGPAASYFTGDDDGYLWLGSRGYSGSATGRSDADTFSDGPAATLTTGTAIGRLAIYAQLIPVWSPGPGVGDRHIASLPFADASAFFASHTGPEEVSTTRASCGWHGDMFAEERGAYAIVKLDGPLSDFVGERIRVQYEDRLTYVFVYDERDIIEDLSLTRRAFMQLAEASTDELDVTVTAMGGS